MPEIMKNGVEPYGDLRASLFQKKGAKREPNGLPNGLLLVPFDHLLAYFFDLCIPWGLQAPRPGPLARFGVVLGALLVSCWLLLVVIWPVECMWNASGKMLESHWNASGRLVKKVERCWNASGKPVESV